MAESKETETEMIASGTLKQAPEKAKSKPGKLLKEENQREKESFNRPKNEDKKTRRNASERAHGMKSYWQDSRRERNESLVREIEKVRRQAKVARPPLGEMNHLQAWKINGPKRGGGVRERESDSASARKKETR